MVEQEGMDTDLDLDPSPSEQDDLDSDSAPFDIRTYGADMTLEIYVNKIDSGEIKIPKFQRNYVWSIKRASKLIESFLLDLPVPQVFLFRESSKRELLVVDGQQRLLTVHRYLKGAWEGDEHFNLVSVKSRWEGKSFTDLSEEDQRRLTNYVLRATIFEQINPADNKSVYEIFERLNTGGMPLNAQEVRDSVIQGNIGDVLGVLNMLPQWRELLGKAEPDRRKKDIEMILRVLALQEGWDAYKKPMKDFITSYMEKHSTLSDDDAAQLRRRFEEVTSVILTQAGRDAFRVSTGRLNIAVLDSIMVAVGSIGPDGIGDLKRKVDSLKSASAYRDYIFQATTNEESVQGRIKMAIEALR